MGISPFTPPSVRILLPLVRAQITREIVQTASRSRPLDLLQYIERIYPGRRGTLSVTHEPSST